MAKTRSLARYRPPPVVVSLPSPRRIGRARTRTITRVARGRSRRRGRSNGGGAATSTGSIVTLAAATAGVGYLAAAGKLNFLPALGGSRMTTLGVAGFAALKFTRNKWVRAAGLGALCAAAFDFGRAKGGNTSPVAGDDGDVEGEDDGSGGGF